MFNLQHPSGSLLNYDPQPLFDLIKKKKKTKTKNGKRHRKFFSLNFMETHNNKIIKT